jgi:hypothetical protein
MPLVIQSTATVANAGLPLLKRDPLMRDDYNGGVCWAFDAAFGWCYGGTSPVPADAVFRDTSEHADARMRVFAGDTGPTIAGGGLDFSNVANGQTYLEIPASAAKTIYDNSQQFLFCIYSKLPTAPDWVTTAGETAFVTFATTANHWQGSTDMLTISMSYNSATPQVWLRRQTGSGAADFQALSGNVGPMQGALAQLAFWRNGTELGASFRTAAGRVTATPKAAGANNTLDFSTRVGRIGIAPTSGAHSSTNNLLNARKLRHYRGWLEALQLSGRSPLTVLDADWDRTIARGVFS